MKKIINRILGNTIPRIGFIEPGRKLLKVNRVDTIHLDDGTTLERKVEFNRIEMMGARFSPSVQEKMDRDNILETIGGYGFRYGNTFYPSNRIKKVDIGEPEYTYE